MCDGWQLLAEDQLTPVCGAFLIVILIVLLIGFLGSCPVEHVYGTFDKVPD
jgi:hypothetical protein